MQKYHVGEETYPLYGVKGLHVSAKVRSFLYKMPKNDSIFMKGDIWAAFQTCATEVYCEW